METFLQWWGGIGYLLSKIFIVRSEFLENGRNSRLIGWFAYLVGMPAWIILLLSRQNWIASAVEIAGIPSVILGIVLTWKQNNNPNKYIDRSIRVFIALVILLGVVTSIYTFGGIKTFSQVLEILIIFGILLSNYLLARKNPFGWLTFTLGLTSTSILMYIQNKPILCIQQLVSLIPVIIGFVVCMKKAKINAKLCAVALFAAISFSNCATIRQKDFSQYNFSLNNTVSIFLIDNKKDPYFCIPVQYMGDYQIGRFEFDHGNILIGDYDILLKRDEINISVYLNEVADEDGGAIEGFNLIYLENNSKVSVSKMVEPLAAKNSPDYLNHYYIFIEKYLTDNEMKNIVSEYKKGNVNSMMSIWYDLTIDSEEQNGSGMLDNFELYDGPGIDLAGFFPNLNFFRAKYLK
jgi:hypothetical protein